MPVIGFINAAPAQSYGPQLAAFLKGLDEKGYVDGRNVTIEYRWAEGRNDRLPYGGRFGASSGDGNCRNHHSGGACGKGER